MICSICRQSDIPDNSGTAIGPLCKAEMGIDYRGECVFVDTLHPRMPVHGLACTMCELGQECKRDLCTGCVAGLVK